MADLINLDNKAQENVSSKKYKILITNKFSEPPFKVGDIVEGTVTVDSDGFLLVKKDFGGKNVQFQFDKGEFQEVNQEKSSSNSTLDKDLNNSNKADKKLTILSTIGGLAGLYYAYSKKKSFWGYIGFMILGGIAGSLVANVVTKMKKPKLADSTKNTNSTTKLTTDKTLPSGGKVDTSKMSKFEKIDLIYKNIKGNESADTNDLKNTKAFLNTLNDAELNIWIALSKAIKDDEVNKAMAKSVDSGFNLIQTKYAISRKDAEQQMKKIEDFMEKLSQSAGVKVKEVKSMFSNFESSLDLDI